MISLLELSLTRNPTPAKALDLEVAVDGMGVVVVGVRWVGGGTMVVMAVANFLLYFQDFFKSSSPNIIQIKPHKMASAVIFSSFVTVKFELRRQSHGGIEPPGMKRELD
ncbi:hypothetical protein HanRHA438_Chr12g0562801 [Helianthus annuus]|nr:hypothetical protein HanRHA438_Chr12g0562801 [Helianthus annuus]